MLYPSYQALYCRVGYTKTVSCNVMRHMDAHATKKLLANGQINLLSAVAFHEVVADHSAKVTTSATRACVVAPPQRHCVTSCVIAIM
jgi:hypothetical protein